MTTVLPTAPKGSMTRVNDAETWEDAAWEAAGEIAREFIPFRETPNDLLLVSVINIFDVIEVLHNEGRLTVQELGWLGARALRGYMKANEPGHRLVDSEDIWHIVNEPLKNICGVIAKKQHDYGHGNIERFGITGIVVRISDKIERLKNLQRRANIPPTPEENGALFDAGTPQRVPRNEPLIDTWLDIVGYCLIGIMVLQGTFTLELAPEVAE